MLRLFSQNASDVAESYLSSHKPFELEPPKNFWVELWLVQVRVEPYELSSHFELMVCKLE